MQHRHTWILFLFLGIIALPAQAVDCNSNAIEDACDIDCGVADGPCDVLDCGLSTDCDVNGIPDECDIGSAPAGCVFPTTLLDNSTSVTDSVFLGPPDDSYRGLGGQVVTYELDCTAIVDGPGPDFNVYEGGGPEYGLVDIFVSGDGVNFFSVNEGITLRVPIPGDIAGSGKRGFDLNAAGLGVARFVRFDGVGTGNDGSSTGFDLDAIGVINGLSLDCDTNGTLDRCQTVDDCNANDVPETCELTLNLVEDCNTNLTADTCDTTGGTGDCDGDTVPDSCEADCNTNATPDDCDIVSMTSADCNVNFVPDECDIASTTVNVSFGSLSPLDGLSPRTVTLLSPPTAAGDVTVTITAVSDLDASSETVAISLNGVPLGTVFATGGLNCSSVMDTIIVPADTFNFAVAGGDAVFVATASSAVNATECTESSLTLDVAYNSTVDCNTNTTLDYCDVDTGASTDFNLNGEPDDCEPDCNSNGTPDDYDVAQGISPDCNANGEPDECDVATMTSLDCNTNIIPDECETDCNSNSVPDDCDLVAMTSPDCNANAVPDECDTATADACRFPTLLLDNATTGADSRFLGVPDDVYWGLGGQIVTYELECAVIADGPGNDFNVYEASTGGPEFGLLEEVLVSQDGVNFFSVKSSEDIRLNIPGDDTHTRTDSVRAYDLAASGLQWARYLRLDGAGTGASGSGTGFDLDTVGFLNTIDNDCDNSGVPDSCETFTDCDANGHPDICEIASIENADCNSNSTPDTCDIVAMTSNDCNADQVPDECQADCNTNTTPDVCELVAMTAEDCNSNGLLDECEFPLASVNQDLGTQSPLSTTYTQTFTLAAPILASGPVTLTITASGDYGASNEFIDVDINGTNVGRVFDVTGPQCAEGTEALILTAAQFNAALTGGPAAITLTVPTAVTSFTCTSASARVEIAYATAQDCNSNSTLDYCDMNGGASTNCNANGTPDDCDIASMSSLDCNLNAVPDECDVAISDCNDNGVPDDCDTATMTSQDCNADDIPDECPICPLVEVSFTIDGSASMSGEGEALCTNITTIVADLQEDLVSVDTEILAINDELVFSCLEDGVPNRYGTAVPLNPPPGNETLGACTGSQSDREDWGPATSVIAGVRAWDPTSVRLVIPIGDEGPRCGDSVNDPGDDREAITHAIKVAVANNVVVSPITGSGSSAGVITLAEALAAGTGGQAFASSDPVNDLSQGIRDIIFNTCDLAGDCNGNDVPDECDISSMTSQDCNFNDVPDECEPDCNNNGIEDSCDITNMTSADANVNMIPDECEGVVLTLDAIDLLWTPAVGAIGYDLVRGDLVTLRSSAGDFSTSTTSCLINDTAALSEPQPADPSAGQIHWFLVRAILGSGTLSYDTFVSGQVASRDAGVLASGNDCP